MSAAGPWAAVHVGGDGPDDGGGEAPTARRRRRAVRTTVSVVCWSVGHNPLGRAHLLADLLAAHHDVELVGSQFGRFGDEVWAPLRDAPPVVSRYEGADFPEYYGTLERLARELRGDVVYVSKPRLPSLGAAILAKALRNRAVLVDCDDFELSFVGAEDGIDLPTLRAAAGSDSFAVPYGEVWTRHCETLVAHSDAVTVSNPLLAERYGGTVIPHARDESVFDPDRYDRGQARARLGAGVDERVVLFAGTPRRHKGIPRVARALAAIANPRYRLYVIGPLGSLAPELKGMDRRITVLPSQPFAELPAVLRAADAVCILQDEDSPVARWQMPAKVTDALAMGVPCLVTPTPPLLPLAEEGLVQAVGEDDLPETLDRVLSIPDAQAEQSTAGRRAFLERYSYAAVRPSWTLLSPRSSTIRRPCPPSGEHWSSSSGRYSGRPHRREPCRGDRFSHVGGPGSRPRSTPARLPRKAWEAITRGPFAASRR